MGMFCMHQELQNGYCIKITRNTVFDRRSVFHKAVVVIRVLDDMNRYDLDNLKINAQLAVASPHV